MKKKIIIYGSICAFIIGFCLLLLSNKQDRNEEETVPVSGNTFEESDTEIETESIKATDIQISGDNDAATEPMETDTNMPDTREAEDIDYVFYLEDEGVRNNPVFAAFIDKEITACDVETEENRYIYECFCECFILPSMEIPPVFGIHYMTEDLNGDGENELLALLQWNTTDGDLLVFHETAGKLYQWETWDDFLCMHMMDIEYHGNGILSQGGGGGALVGRYNAEGKIEYILKYFRDWNHTEEGEYWKSGHLILYKDGYEEKELRWEGFYFHEDDSWEMTPENQANKDEFDVIMSGIEKELGEGNLFERVEWEQDAQKIPLAELFKKQ